MRVEFELTQDRIKAVRVAPDAGCHPRVVVEHDGLGFAEYAIAIAHSLADPDNVARTVNLYSPGVPAKGLTRPELLTSLRSTPYRLIISHLQTPPTD
jgi:dienelactone hydrolase